MWPLYEPQASQTDPTLTAQLLWTYTAALSELTARSRQLRAPTSIEIGVASCWESLILSSPKAWVRARLLLEATFVHLTILWALGLGTQAPPPILDPTSRKDDRRRDEGR